MEMPLVAYGHSGYPLLMFPTAAADFLEYERFHLIDSIRQHIESGRLRAYSINSVNRYSLMNDQAPPPLKAELLARYDRVIFDAPPVGPVADPVVLGTQVDGVLLVVKCEKTTKELARQAVRALSDAKARLLGVVLNDVDVTEKRYSRVYYSYYGRYRGYYGNDKEKPGKEAA
jgi:Mrp family chromosome partitioning ATPase